MQHSRRDSILWLNHFAITPKEGGGTRHFELGRELVARGWDVTVGASDFNLQTRRYTRRASGSSRQPIAEDVEGVQFQWLWAAPYSENNWRRGWNWITFALSARRWRPAGATPDVVIGSSPHLFAALAGERIARRFRVPFVFEVRDLWPESMLAAGGRKGPGYYLLGAIARYLYARASRIVVLSRGTEQYLVRHGIDAERIVYVPNGVTLDAPNAPNALDRPDHNADGRFSLVYAGAHGPANGLDVVLDAAERLRPHDQIRFLLVGDGPAKAELRADAARRGLDNVEFRDPIPKHDMPALLGSAGAGLMVLRDAPLFAFGVSPNKLFDYFGAALPVVCNVPGEVAAMVADARAGEQAGDASAVALADAIQRLAGRSAAERAEMGRAGRTWVGREHGRAILAARLDEALRSLVAR